MCNYVQWNRSTQYFTFYIGCFHYKHQSVRAHSCYRLLQPVSVIYTCNDVVFHDDFD